MTFAEMLPFILIAVAVLLVIVALVYLSRRSTTVVGEDTKGDVLDEGAARASRNQALIDAPRSVSQDVGITSANANSDQIQAACETGDAEAGVSVAPTVGDPVPQPVPTPAPSAGSGDDLTKIKGLGPKLATLLGEQGITTYAQIANWSDTDVERVDATLGRFAGRITRDQWVEQAKLLSSGDEAQFFERFGQNK